MEWLLRHRRGVAIVVLAGSAVLGYQMRDPSVLYQTYDSDRPEDAEGEQYKQFTQTFGEGELLQAVISTDDVFRPDVLRYVQSRTAAIAAVPTVRRVDSLTTAHDMVVDDSGNVGAEPLFAEVPADPAELQRRRQVALRNPLLGSTILSADSTVTVIGIIMPPLMRGSRDAKTVVGDIRALLEEGRPDDVDVYLTGLSPMFVDSTQCAQADFRRFFLLTWLLMGTLLFLAFRTVRGLLLPLGVTGLAVFWTLGLMAMAGETISAVGAMLPTLIAVVCFSDAVHVLAHYYREAQSGANRHEVIVSTMEHMITACFLTSATTAAAFGSLVAAKLSSIQRFGLWAAGGIMLGYVLIVAMTPTILSWLPLPGKDVQRRYKHSLIGYLLGRIVHLIHARGWLAPAISAVLAVLALLAMARLRVETSLTAFLPDSAPAMRGLAIAQEKLTGFGAVEVVLDGPEGCFKQPWALRELRELEAFFENREEVGVALTVRDLLQWTHESIEETDEDLLSDRRARGLIAEYLFLSSQLADEGPLNSLITEDRSSARIAARLQMSGSGEKLSVISDLDAFATKHLDERLSYHTTGEADRISKQIRSVMRSLTDSFGMTLLVILLFMLWLLRSARAAAIAMIPNILPVVLTVGAMGVLGITANVATVMITSIAIGIAVDDTVHFLVSYKRELRENPDPAAAIENTVLHTGRAITFTSAAMAAGCGIFMLSDFAPNRDFGFLMVFAMLTALLADLLVLPFLVRISKLDFTPHNRE